MTAPPPHRVCLIDALGTTVRLRPPWQELDPALTRGLSEERVREAFRAEMSFYAAHAHEATDSTRLSDLRARCAALLSTGLGREVSVGALMDAIVFEAYEDAAPALDELHLMGLRVLCVSNWDCGLPEVLARVGLADRLDGVVVSALAGARKPDPEIFETALRVAGCTPSEAIHVGDSSDDVEGARAAGIEVIRIDRDGGADIASLREIVPRLWRTAPIGQHPGQ